MINEIKKELKNTWSLFYYVEVHNQKESFRLQTYLFENEFQWTGDNNPSFNTLSKINYYILHDVRGIFTIQYLIGELKEELLRPYTVKFIDFSDLFLEKKFLNSLFDGII